MERQITLNEHIQNVYLVVSEFRGTVRGQTLNAIEQLNILQSHKAMVDAIVEGQKAIEKLNTAGKEKKD